MALERIVAAKREAVAERRRRRPLQSFEAGLEPSSRSLADSLRRSGRGFILECKRRSPSEGLLRQDFRPAELARAYAEVASGISVLTDEPFFGGSFEDLASVRAAVEVPVLCKDFVVDPYQIYEARERGADAILLMLSVLEDAELGRCLETVRGLGMEALVEVHDREELARAVEAGATLLGINNRNLKDLTIDLRVTEQLAPLVPPGVLKISESGIRGREDVLRLAPLVDGFLVGSALMKTARVDLAARELVYGRVKVCGLTRPEDALSAWRAGASWGGLIFAPESPRRLTLDRAREVRRAAPLRWAGVFVDEEAAEVARVARELGLDAVQLHGEEAPGLVAEVRRRVDCEVWKAWRVRGEVPLPEATGADRLVLDAYAEGGARGGTGRSFDWEILREYPRLDRVVLGGGLRPANLEAAAGVGAWALDVNSGVEEAPGIKSERLLFEAFRALRMQLARR